MKPTRMRNNQIYRATMNTQSKQLGSTLSKDLRKKYGKRNARVTLGDTVKVTRGEYKGVDGKVSKISTQKNSIAVEGIKKEKSKGDKFDVYIHTSNVMITSLNTDDKWRMKKLEGGSKPAKQDTSKSKEEEEKSKTEATKEGKQEDSEEEIEK